jgi:ADP-ribose pyrophosphatase YjhB (NUDIX family)
VNINKKDVRSLAEYIYVRFGGLSVPFYERAIEEWIEKRSKIETAALRRSEQSPDESGRETIAQGNALGIRTHHDSARGLDARASSLPRIGSAVIVQHEGRVLLGKRNKQPHFGDCVVPGGAVKPFESIAEAGEREVYEETGLRIVVTDLCCVREVISKPDEHRIVVFSCGQLVSNATPKASDDLSEAAFFPVAQIGSLPLTVLTLSVLREAGVTKPAEAAA